MTKYMIGIDAGGTSTKACAYNKNFEVLAQAKTGCGSPAVVNEDIVWQNIEQAIDAVLKQINKNYILDDIEIGISAYSILNKVNEKKQQFEKKYQVTINITTDTLIALYSILQDKYESGVVALSGTGVAIYAENKNENVLIGGWGHIIRELGSAYACVHHLAIKIIDQIEDDKPLSTLAKAFISHLKDENIKDLKHLFYECPKSTIAKEVLFIKNFALNGDEEAQELLYNEGRYLGIQTVKAIKKCHLQTNYAIGMRGGFVDDKFIIKGFNDYLREQNVQGIICNEFREPIEGTFYLYMKKVKKC